ncbi:MAG TPA: NAD(P)/FAD-dependent oxidoreductase [Candidatus Acidoferrales bacterium]|nr:NAD(P)/FAD-dependent oxidoreductase [Candidatus Acidoferrales bacterium]
MKNQYDAVVVGSGPNGLAAAITLAKAGLSVLLIEGNPEVGGGARSAELTLPGYWHDLCSAIYPFATASPFFQSLDLRQYGLEWIQPELPLAHPLEAGRAACLYRSLETTAEGLGADGASYKKLLRPLVENSELLIPEILKPLLHLPAAPILLSRFGLAALQPVNGFCRRHFKQPAAQALFSGLAAHSFLSLRQLASSAIGLALNILAHSAGWPLPRGGAGNVSAALVRSFQALGGAIQLNCFVRNIDDLPRSKAILFDLAPRHFLAVVGHHFPKRYADALARFQHGPGVFKVDYALSAPIPWKHQDCRKAGTVHVGGTLEEITASEEEVSSGFHPEKPFVLVTQPSVFDPSRAPAGKHTAWAYCHVPSASTLDQADRMEAQIERFAPGFRDCILKRSTRTCRDLELSNPNLVGGDINGGRANLKQLLVRPILSRVPYRTPLRGIYLCSASTPPGGGVHGMCGCNAARFALRDIFGIEADQCV